MLRKTRRARAWTLDEVIATLPPADREAVERRAAKLRQLSLARRVARKRRALLREPAK